jgi:hypothetical protein
MKPAGRIRLVRERAAHWLSKFFGPEVIEPPNAKTPPFSHFLPVIDQALSNGPAT